MWIRAVVALFAVLIFGISACGPVRLVSPYDEMIDRGTGELNTDLVTFVLKMESAAGSPQGTYEANKGFYADVKGKLTTLRLRTEAAPKNDITVHLFEELDGNVERLRQLHESGQAGGLSKPLAEPALSAVETNVRAILKLESEKRRGDKD